MKDIDKEQQQLDLARTLFSEGHLAEAAEALTALVLAETPLFEAYYDLGCLAVRQGETDTAISLFGMTLERNAYFAPARRNLALMLGTAHRYDEALLTLSPRLPSSRATQEDLNILRGLLEATTQIAPATWAQLLADLRAMDPMTKMEIDRLPALETVANHLRTENERLREDIQSRASLNEDLGYLSANGLNGFKWFKDSNEYFAWDRQVSPVQENIERIIERQSTFPGYCQLCERSTTFTVSSGLTLNGHTHLREGMICTHCGIHNRGRLLGLSISSFVRKTGNESQILLMEASTPLFRLLSSRHPSLIGSEFVSSTLVSGENTEINGLSVRHESILNLSFQDESLDLVAHADVLEHIPDVAQALRECFRVLKPGGQLIFSAPFATHQEKSKRRAKLTASGEIEHILPAAHHGSHLVYFDYGWDLLDLCKSAGFTQVHLGVCFDPLQGLLSTGRFDENYMQPIIFLCQK